MGVSRASAAVKDFFSGYLRCFPTILHRKGLFTAETLHSLLCLGVSTRLEGKLQFLEVKSRALSAPAL